MTTREESVSARWKAAPTAAEQVMITAGREALEREIIMAFRNLCTMVDRGHSLRQLDLDAMQFFRGRIAEAEMWAIKALNG